ncbi:MAG: hypothetical protein ACYSX0_21725 [Planctomycetota bacterium]|jgi:hypothetical protein
MRRALLLLALLALLPPPAYGDEELVALWLGKLTGQDKSKHELARNVLARQGTPALPQLREALGEAPGKEAHDRVAAVIREIEMREPHGIAFDAGMPKMRIFLDMVNEDRFEYVIRVRNRSEKSVVLWPFLSLRVLDSKGEEVGPSQRIGRWGLRKSANLLEEVRFVTLAPGKAWSIATGLKRYVHDPDFITGWQLPAAGTYTLELTYHYDRATQKKRCDPKWELLDDPKQPWNRALEMKHTFTAEMKVDKRP